jgi:hypothetical protein
MSIELQFDGGMNNAVRPDRLPANVARNLVNYVVNGDGILERRRSIDRFNDDLQGKLTRVFGGGQALKMAPPYYPATKPDDMTGEFILIFYGSTSSGYKLAAFYEKASGWTYQAADGSDLLASLNSAGIVYTEESSPIFYVGEDRVLVADGENPVHYVRVNHDGEFEAGKMGLRSPARKADIILMNEFEDNFTPNSNNMSSPGLLQVVYTAVTEDGIESGPSPISETADLQLFRKDDDGNDDLWIYRVGLSNLNIPDVDDDLVASLKYFNIYYRVMRYSEGLDAADFQFAARVVIADKKTTFLTNNYYSISQTVSGVSLPMATMQNVVAKESLQVAGVMLVGNTQERMSFLWDGGAYYDKIQITNNNNRNYVDAVIKVKIGGDGEILYEYGRFLRDANNDKNVMLYDQDTVTPLNYIVVYYIGTFYLYIKIPLLQANSVHTIFAVYNDTDASSPIMVPDDFWQDSGKKHGKPFWYGTDSWMWQGVFQKMRVLDEQVVVSAPLNGSSPEIERDYPTNYANDRDDLVSNSIDLYKYKINPYFIFGNTVYNDREILYDTVFGIPSPPGYMQYLYDLMGNGCGKFPYSLIFSNQGIPTHGSVSFICNLNEGRNENGILLDMNIMKLYCPSEDEIFLKVLKSDKVNYELYRFMMPSFISSDIYNNLSQWGIALSWDLPNVTLFIYIYSTDKIYTDTVEISTMSNFDDVSILGFVLVGINQVRNLVVHSDFYYNERDIQAVRNLFCQQPRFYEFIGWDGEENRNISVAASGETLGYKSYGNMLRWTLPNQMNLNPLFFKKIRSEVLAMIVAPGFLQDEYRNTVLVFTRNEIYRFVLSGDPENWSASTENLIEENTGYGLLARKSLIRVGETIYWLSEQGFMEWSPRGMRNLTQNRIRTIRDEAAVSVYDPVSDHVILKVSGTQ